MLQTFEINSGWQFCQADKQEWLNATVPGCVHTDLLANKLIDDPFYRDNEKHLQWIEEKSWIYQTVFDYPAERLELENQTLVFYGLDTYARIYLNEHLVLQAENMHRIYRVACEKFLLTGPNTLRIEFDSPVTHDQQKADAWQPRIPSIFDQQNGTSVHTRKAMYHYGWDWGPRFVTAGIWQPIVLECWENARIDAVHIVQNKLTSELARLSIGVDVEADKAVDAKLVIRAEHGFELEYPCVLHQGMNQLAIPAKIEYPEFWWPHGYGAQHLYNFTIELYMQGNLVDVAQQKIGLRTLELRRQPDSFGESFEFVVNGVAIFAKGANWIPADSFVNRVSAERYRHLLTSAVQANMNMLRVWGGGIYEQNIFYDLCDELGLLVWQDFMFSCALYPANAEFLQNVEQEAIGQIKRLRHHPSIALWCGNNEIEMGWTQFGWHEKYPRDYFDQSQHIFTKLLPQLCNKYDPLRPYWPSSPSSLTEDNPQSPQQGDVHYWQVWHEAAPFEKYYEQYPRFMSEYGFQSFPLLASVASFCEPEDLSITSPVMQLHQKHPRGNELIHEYMLREYPESKDFAAFLYISQILQAEGIKKGAEQLRRIRPVCMGSLYWQLNDCWPVASWSSIDYYGRWKALHYYAKRFYAPLLLCVYPSQDELAVYLVSDRQDVFSVKLQIKLMDFYGRVLETMHRDLFVPGACSFADVILHRHDLARKADLSETFLLVQAEENGQIVAENMHFFVPTKQQKLPKPNVISHVEGEELHIMANTLARHVYIASGDVCQLSDNFFDLLPGEEKIVHVTGNLGKFTIQSLTDAFTS